MLKGNLGKKVVTCAMAATLCFGTGAALAGCSSNDTASKAADTPAATSTDNKADDNKAAEPAADAQQAAEETPAATEGETRIFVDSVGREVEVPANITAITPSGFTAQMVLLTFAPDKMVSLASEIPDDQLKFFDIDAVNMPITGAMFGKSDTFNIEEVAASGTQIIIDTGEAKEGIADDLDAMQEKIGIPCVFIETTLDNYGTAYEMLGDLLGDEARGKELSEYCQNAYKTTVDTMATIPQDQWVKLAYLMGEDGLNAIAKDSYQGGVIDLCADNVYVDENASGSGQGMEISMEQLAVWDPACIVFASGSIFDTVADDPTWADIAAIADNNYYEVPDLPWNWLNNPPTVNQVMGMQWLPRLLYPDAFEDSIQDVATSYYKTFYNYDLSDEEFQEIAGNALPHTAE